MKNDYLSSVKKSFSVSLEGAKKINEYGSALSYVAEIARLYKKRRINYSKIMNYATLLVAYDVFFRNPFAALQYGYNEPTYNSTDIYNLETMLNSVEQYFHEQRDDKITDLGFAVSGHGTRNILPSDGDLLTERCIIDFKCSKTAPTNKETFQILLYYVLGMHENPDRFQKIKTLKLINPILGKVWSYDVARLYPDEIKHLEKNILGYNHSIYD